MSLEPNILPKLVPEYPGLVQLRRLPSLLNPLALTIRRFLAT